MRDVLYLIDTFGENSWTEENKISRVFATGAVVHNTKLTHLQPQQNFGSNHSMAESRDP